MASVVEDLRLERLDLSIRSEADSVAEERRMPLPGGEHVLPSSEGAADGTAQPISSNGAGQEAGELAALPAERSALRAR